MQNPKKDNPKKPIGLVGELFLCARLLQVCGKGEVSIRVKKVQWVIFP